MPTAIDYHALADHFDNPAIHAIALMGSHARGDAGPYSDVDLVRFVTEQDLELPGAGSHWINGRLVVVKNVAPAETETWFTRPELAVSTVAGVRSAHILIDRNETFAQLQARAHSFVWSEALQLQADIWASEQMVGWSEEMHKGLEGLRRGDIGRLLNSLFGGTFGLSRVLQVQRGVLLTGDNGFYAEVAAVVGLDAQWTLLRGIAFGVVDVHDRPPSLRERVVAGLGLYVATVELLGDAIQPEDAPLINATVKLINERLEDAYHGE
jgi:hypothetical protein